MEQQFFKDFFPFYFFFLYELGGHCPQRPSLETDSDPN